MKRLESVLEIMLCWFLFGMSVWFWIIFMAFDLFMIYPELMSADNKKESLIYCT